MKCIICKKDITCQATTVVTLERDCLIMLAKGVPAQICTNYGEAYIEENVTANLLKAAEKTARSGI